MCIVTNRNFNTRGTENKILIPLPRSLFVAASSPHVAQSLAEVLTRGGCKRIKKKEKIRGGIERNGFGGYKFWILSMPSIVLFSGVGTYIGGRFPPFGIFVRCVSYQQEGALHDWQLRTFPLVCAFHSTLSNKETSFLNIYMCIHIYTYLYLYMLLYIGA